MSIRPCHKKVDHIGNTCCASSPLNKAQNIFRARTLVSVIALMYLSCTGIMYRAIVSRILPGHSLATCDRCCYDHRNCLLFVLILPRVVPIDGLFPRLVIPGFCLSPDVVRGFNWHTFCPTSVFPISLLRISVLCPMPDWNSLLFKKAPSPPRHLRMSCCVVF